MNTFEPVEVSLWNYINDVSHRTTYFHILKCHHLMFVRTNVYIVMDLEFLRWQHTKVHKPHLLPKKLNFCYMGKNWQHFIAQQSFITTTLMNSSPSIWSRQWCPLEAYNRSHIFAVLSAAELWPTKLFEFGYTDSHEMSTPLWRTCQRVHRRKENLHINRRKQQHHPPKGLDINTFLQIPSTTRTPLSYNRTTSSPTHYSKKIPHTNEIPTSPSIERCDCPCLWKGPSVSVPSKDLHHSCHKKYPFWDRYWDSISEDDRFVDNSKVLSPSLLVIPPKINGRKSMKTRQCGNCKDTS